MNDPIILSWEDADPTAIYTQQLAANPLFWSETHNTWATYSYQYCKAIFLSDDAHVPEAGINPGLNGRATLMAKRLVRLSNNGRHTAARQAAIMVYNNMQPVSTAHILEQLLAGVKNGEMLDWVAVVGKKLPMLLISRSLGFSERECGFVVDNITSLAKLMLPNKTPQDLAAINQVVDDFYVMAERYVIAKGLRNKADDEEIVELFADNLVGLLIQTYDGGRGLLCNALLTMCAQNGSGTIKRDKDYFKKLVAETLRLYPPVHNTKRIAAKDIPLGGQLIKAGDPVLIVLAAANIDPAVFDHPLVYDASRANNDKHLTFGMGGHSCLAKYMMIDMAVNACHFLSERYSRINIPEQEFKYEPQLNVKLVKELIVQLWD